MIKLTLDSVASNDIESTNVFLENSIPFILKMFWFNHYSTLTTELNKLNILANLDSLCLAAQSVTSQFYICSSVVSQKEFEELISAAQHCKVIGFTSWFIDIETACDFSRVVSSDLMKLDLSTVHHNYLFPFNILL